MNNFRTLFSRFFVVAIYLGQLKETNERRKKMSYQKEDIEWDSAQAELEYDLSEEKMAKLENMAHDNEN